MGNSKAFCEGLAQGADIIELDVQLSADGHAVAFYDEQLDRTTNGHGPLDQYTLVELKALDAGSWFDPRFPSGPGAPRVLRRVKMLNLRRPPASLSLLIAHRGASDLSPENTMAAFSLAAEDGADIVELDVRLSRDGHVVVIHDAYLSRTTDGPGDRGPQDAGRTRGSRRRQLVRSALCR